MTPSLSRRRLLALGAGAAGTLAGCTGADDGAPAGIRLPAFHLQNEGTTAHSVDLLIERDDEVVHWRTHDLEPNAGSTVVEASWPDDPATFEVKARVDDAARRTGTFGAEDARGEDPCLLLKLSVLEGADGAPYFGSFWTGACAESGGSGTTAE